MTKSKRSHRSPRKGFDVNLPFDLTPKLIELIKGLPEDTASQYLKEHFLSKFVSKDTDPPELRKSRAIEKWLDSEKLNEATAERLSNTDPEFNILPRVTFSRFVSWCRAEVARIIGDTPPVEALIGSFSGGASTSRTRNESHPAFKYVGTAHVTERAMDWIPLLVEECPGWFNRQNHYLIEVVRGNVLFTVPKKTDIDRVACKEPDLNMFIQKGIGGYFRKCLRRTGINLNDQSINRSLAQSGSVTDELSTLDLSSASDSVTSELVSLFLPEIWYTLLDSVRSPVTLLPDGEEHLNQMFSSMGNGFTFELESLIFLVIARAVNRLLVTPGVISIYGDDIICPRETADLLSYVLGYFGFRVNLDKSFVSGPIRESCGGHYYLGRDITPFYLRGPIVTLVDLIDVANKLREWGTRDWYKVVNPYIEDIWLWLKGYVPPYLWGGGDYSFKYQLVSHDTPSKRLYEETKRKGTGYGGYLHWLNATWDRTEETDGVQTSVLTKSLEGSYTLKSVRDTTVPRLEHQFYHELVRRPSQ